MSDLVRKALAIGPAHSAFGSLKELLRGAGIALLEAPEGGSGLKAFYAERPDVILLDLDLEEPDGFGVLTTVRELSDVPLLAVTGTETEEDERIRALRAGADDCVSPAISEREVMARLEALLRRTRSRAEATAIIEDDFIHIDHPRHRVEVLGIEVALTPIEFRMLSVFAENPGRVMGHGQLLDLVWGDRIRDKDEVKLYVSYLRRKLGGAAEVDPIETVRGVGYRYRPRRVEGGRSVPH